MNVHLGNIQRRKALEFEMTSSIKRVRNMRFYEIFGFAFDTHYHCRMHVCSRDDNMLCNHFKFIMRRHDGIKYTMTVVAQRACLSSDVVKAAKRIT